MSGKCGELKDISHFEFQLPCQTFHTVPGLQPPCPFYFSFLPPSENLKPMSTPSASTRIPTVHLSSQELCSVSSAFHYLSSCFCTLSCCRKAVVGRGKLVPLAKTFLLNVLLLRMNIFHFPGIHANICGVWQKNLLSVFNIKEAENEIEDSAEVFFPNLVFTGSLLSCTRSFSSLQSKSEYIQRNGL